MNILIVNSLDARYGSTYRVRAFRDALAARHAVRYVEEPGSAPRKLAAAARAAIRGDYDLLLTQKFNPITLAAMAVARMRGKPVMVDWDDWDVGLQSNGVKRMVSAFCEIMGPRIATWITTHNAEILAHARRYRPSRRVDQGYNPALFHPDRTDKAAARARWKIPPGVRVVGHLCTFTHGGTLDLEEILAAWSRIRSPQVVFMLVGGGPLERAIGDKIARFGLQSRVIRTGLLDREDTARALSCWDVATVWMSDTPSNRARVSLKTIECLAMGLPVAGRVVGETAALVGRWVEDDGDPAETMEALALGERAARPADVARFSWKETTAPLCEWIEEIENAVNQ